MDTPSEEGSISGGVVKVTRELLFSRDGDRFSLYVCVSGIFWRVKSTVLIKYSGNCNIGNHILPFNTFLNMQLTKATEPEGCRGPHSS